MKRKIIAIGDNNKNASPFDNKWKTPDKRKTVDDSYANAPIPRLVPLRGSDFTGLGIEVCGGLKEGIYVKKVMPQGPAANIVNRGTHLLLFANQNLKSKKISFKIVFSFVFYFRR